MTAVTKAISLACLLVMASVCGCLGEEPLPDLDNDGIPDAEDPDADGDRMGDGWEVEHGLDPMNVSDGASDLDNDTLIASKEYQLGTDPNDPDTDDDRIQDGVEVLWHFNPANGLDGAGDADSDDMPNWWELLWELDPWDDRDAFLDPDSDGYDHDGDGRMGGPWDYVSTYLPMTAGDRDYEARTVASLEGIREGGALVSLEQVTVMDAGTLPLGEGDTAFEELALMVVDSPDDTEAGWLRVEVRRMAPRPSNLTARSAGDDGDTVHVHGILRVEGDDRWVEVRTWEHFPNVMEYQVGIELGDVGNSTVPREGDTDDDGMSDGWEAYHGSRAAEARGRWPLDPSWDADAYLDPDGDVLETRWRFVEWLWEDPDGDGVLEPPDGATPYDAMTLGYNIHEFINGTDPFDEDTDDDAYPVDGGNMDDFDEIVHHRTDPTEADTDADGAHDGWEVHHNLRPDDASDGGQDPDEDGLTNSEEHVHGCHPWKNDTDGDRMHDGWEVLLGLEPTDPADADGDPDGDGVPNWQEFERGTDPFEADS